MKKTKSKRLLTLVLALVLVFALSLGALAAWTSFQNDETNNGTIDPASPPPTSTPTVTAVDLSMHNPYGDVYSGVDAETVMNNGFAYTLYNGGISSGLAGGARLRATVLTPITDPNDPNVILYDTGDPYWDAQLDACPNNESQLATPYLDTASEKLYTTVTIRTPIVDDYSVGGWTASGNATITNGVATFASGGGEISRTITIDAVNYLYLPTNLSGTDGTYTISLVSSGTPSTTFTLVNNGYVSSWGTYDSYTGVQIPADTYTLKIEVTGNTAAATMDQIVINRYDWRLYCVSNLNATCPTVTRLLGCNCINTAFEGQINTPIYSDGDGNIYFGVYGGTHSYYQLNTATLALAQFNAGSEDFYWAGAVKVTDAHGDDYIVFGSDSGNVYVRSKNAFSTVGTVIDLASLAPAQVPPVTPGQIRSSLVAYSDYIYFTSKGTGDGWLWRIGTGHITNPSSSEVKVKSVYLGNVSVSTPVISENGIVYIGSNNYDPILFTTTGRIEAYTLDCACITQAVYVGDPVQASPIVYTDIDDYIYFTTNSNTGAGYCYSFDGTNAASVWTAGGTSYNRYTVQGFSSDDGYLIYGDDSGRLYIMN